MAGGEEKTHKVVISGIAGRFPKSNNVTELKYNLLNKIDCTTEEHGRWSGYEPSKIPQRIAMCNDIQKFDRVFFGVHSKLTLQMDPGHRVLMENTFEAIVDAGINPKTLKGTNVAVYTAANILESENRLLKEKYNVDGFGIVGRSRGMIPNRISFFFGFTGKSFIIDNGSAGTASALEQAYYDIKHNRCDSAIVAGCILCLHPQISYHLKNLGQLSSDGITRSFDDKACGHTRSECMSVLFLQKAQDAKRIYQEVVYVKEAYSAGEHLNTLIHPTVESQIEVMQRTLNETGLTPDDVSFVEATGVGIKKYDEQELRAIDAVFRERKDPLYVGSITSCLGNAIPCNTLNSIIKIIIGSESGWIAPNMNYETPNSEAACLLEDRVRILTEATPWKGKYSLVNALSEGGSVANVILKAPSIEKKNNGLPDDKLQRLVIASGRTKKAVQKIFKYMGLRPVDADFLQLTYDVFQSGVDGHLYRGYSIFSPEKPSTVTTNEISFFSGEKHEVWWVFSGMGSQWAGMGDALLKLPVFEASIRKCDKALKPLGYDIYKVITDKNPHAFDNIVDSFIGIAAIQIGLVDVLRALELEPDYIIGHSVGELGCGYADNCFSAEQMILAALSRGLASVETELIEGSMAAVGLGYEDVKPLCPSDIDIACHNGPDSSTISGPAKSMKEFVAKLKEKGIFAKEVPCSNIAYHSRYISDAGTKLLERLRTVIPEPKPRSAKWLSTSVPSSEWNTLKARWCSAEYHTNNLLNPVLFDETSRLIPANAICIEIAPHGLLQAILKKSLPSICVNIPLTKRGHPDNFEFLLGALGKMYNVGLHPQVANLYPKVEYPVGRGTASLSPLIEWDHSQDWTVNYFVPREEYKESSQTFVLDLNDETFAYLRGNRINGKLFIPLSVCLEQVREMLNSFSSAKSTSNVVFENIRIRKLILNVPEDNIITLTFMIPKGSGNFEVLESDTLIISGVIRITKTPEVEKIKLIESKEMTLQKCELESDGFYTEMKMRGFQYNDTFKTVLKSSIVEKKGVLKWSNDCISYIDGALQFYTFRRDTRQVEVPLSIRKIVIDNDFHNSTIKETNEKCIFADENMNYLSAGGLEMQGIKLSVVPKNLEQNRLSADTSVVVPNVDESVISITFGLRLILQLVFENIFSSKLPVIQIVNQRNGITHTQRDIMSHIPEASLFKFEGDICYEDATFNKALTIVEDEISDHEITKVSRKLGIGRFVLVFINSTKRTSILQLIESEGLKIVFMRKLNNQYVVLLRKKHSIFKFHSIDLSKNIEDSINKIDAIQNLSDSERIVVVARTGINIRLDDLIISLVTRFSMDKIRIFDFRNTNIPDRQLVQMLEKQAELDILVNVLTPENTWATLRRTEASLKPKLFKSWKASPKYLYDPTTFIWTEGPAFPSIMNTVKVEYSSLNPQDLLIANGTFGANSSKLIGKSRIEPMGIGFEFSGTDANGTEVMGIQLGNTVANYVNIDPDWIWSLPKSWSLEDAATVPLSYIVAYSACFLKVELKMEDKVVITNPCTVYGLAILNLALEKKCAVIVRYETDEERNILQSLKPSIPKDRMFRSNGESFRDAIFTATDGQGVDVLICNECQDIELYFSLLRHHARVVLISDLDDNKIHEKIGTVIFFKELAFYSIVPEKVITCESKMKNILAKMLNDGINAGHVKPLPRTVFDRESLNKAMTVCRENKLRTKILIKIQPEGSNVEKALAIPRLYCSENNSYIILEGLTDFGLELIDWLVTRGAKYLIATSVFKVDNGFAKLRMKYWRDYGIHITVHEEFDYSNKKHIAELFRKAQSIGRLDGFFDLRQMNLATNKSLNLFEATTLVIDEESRRFATELRFFVVCSVANDKARFVATHSSDQVVEKLIYKRKEDKLPGLWIKWNLIPTSTMNGVNLKNNTLLLPASKYVQKLDDILGTDESIVRVSYYVSTSDQVEQDPIDKNISAINSDADDMEAFKIALYENDGVYIAFEELQFNI